MRASTSTPGCSRPWCRGTSRPTARGPPPTLSSTTSASAGSPRPRSTNWSAPRVPTVRMPTTPVRRWPCCCVSSIRAMSRLREEQKAAMSRLREEQKAAMSRLREEQTAASHEAAPPRPDELPRYHPPRDRIPRPRCGGGQRRQRDRQVVDDRGARLAAPLQGPIDQERCQTGQADPRRRWCRDHRRNLYRPLSIHLPQAVPQAL